MTRLPHSRPRAPQRAQTNEELKQDFSRVRAELLEAHRALTALQQLIRDDPWLEAQELPTLRDLHADREALLSDFARVSLAWMLRGGHIEMQDLREPPRPRAEPAPEPPPSAAPEPPRPVARVEPPEAPRAPQPVIPVAELLEPMGQVPDQLTSSAAVADELQRLIQSIQPHLTDAWSAHDKVIQRALVGHVVARARRVQDEIPSGLVAPSSIPDLDRVFSTMTAYSKREQPGFVFGLMRSHTPVHGSWRQDARAWLQDLEPKLAEEQAEPSTQALAALETLLDDDDQDDGIDLADDITAAALACIEAGVDPEDLRLVRLLKPRYELLKKHTEFKKLRKAIREFEVLDQEFESEMKSPVRAVPADWPFRDQVGGKRVSVLGGSEVAPDARERIQKAFELDVLDWVTLDHDRNVELLGEAIRGGTVEMVLVLRRFVGHDADDRVQPACEEAGVPYVAVEGGYGVAAIRMALERALLQ